MADDTELDANADPYDLNRFVQAQEQVYDRALAEIRAGSKRSHWMWYIFPQIDGLSESATTKRYSIKSAAEAEAYLAHPTLGPRLHECAEALLAINDKKAWQIFNFPDDIKLLSCATLFAQVSPRGSIFARLLDKYFPDERDQETLRLLGAAPHGTT